MRNRGIDTALLRANLATRGYSAVQISAALQKLETAVGSAGIALHRANLRTYQLLRYGVPAQFTAGQAHETVLLIDWANPEKTDFALTQEVTLKGGYPRRPDIVLYLNGMAIAVIKLKRTSVELADGVRQLITNLEVTSNKGFFSTNARSTPRKPSSRNMVLSTASESPPVSAIVPSRSTMAA